jgi:hypothetical protein
MQVLALCSFLRISVQRRIEANPPADELRTLLARKSDLRRLLASL